MIREAVAWVGLSRTPRAGAGSNGARRVSVNPLSRAAGEATYKTTLEKEGGGKQDGKVRQQWGRVLWSVQC